MRAFLLGPNMKFIKPFYGVPAGVIYPIRYAVGDECPPELLEAAKIAGAVDAEKEIKPRAKAK